MSESRFKLADVYCGTSAKDRYWQRRARGVCVSCRTLTNGVRCDNCKAAFRQYGLVWNRARRAELYSLGMCSECKVRRRNPRRTLCRRCTIANRTRCAQRVARIRASRLCLDCFTPVSLFLRCLMCRKKRRDDIAAGYLIEGASVYIAKGNNHNG